MRGPEGENFLTRVLWAASAVAEGCNLNASRFDNGAIKVFPLQPTAGSFRSAPGFEPKKARPVEGLT